MSPGAEMGIAMLAIGALAMTTLIVGFHARWIATPRDEDYDLILRAGPG